MPIVFACSCGKHLRVADANVGKLVACPACKARLRVPESGPPAPASPPAAALPEFDPPPPAPPPLPKPTRPTPPPLPPASSPDISTDPPPYEVIDDDPPYEASDEPDYESPDEGPASAPREAVDVKHYGPIKGDPDYFQRAPARIGEIRSAHTSLATHQKHWSMLQRLWLSAIITAVVMVIGIIVIAISMFNQPGPPVKIGEMACAATFFGLLVFLLALGIIAVATQFSYFCGYVGANGIAYYECKGSRSNLVKKQAFEFDEAADLRTKLVHTFVNGIYQSTAYEFNWTDEDDVEVLSIKGVHNSHDAMPPDTSSYHLGMNAEYEWSIYLLGKILAKLKSGGSYTFHVGSRGTLKLRSDSLLFRMGSKEQEFFEEDIAEMKIEQGVISLKEPGAKQGWFTSTGIHSFNFADLSNARVFLMLVADLFDVPIN